MSKMKYTPTFKSIKLETNAVVIVKKINISSVYEMVLVIC